MGRGWPVLPVDSLLLCVWRFLTQSIPHVTVAAHDSDMRADLKTRSFGTGVIQHNREPYMGQARILTSREVEGPIVHLGGIAVSCLPWHRCTTTAVDIGEIGFVYRQSVELTQLLSPNQAGGGKAETFPWLAVDGRGHGEKVACQSPVLASS